MKQSRFSLYAWFVLAFNVGVVLWGAYVRATGSGAGCGSHWPLCNGVVIPRAGQIETLIEFAHRATSGLALILVVGMLVWAYRVFPKGHVVRLGARFSMLFIITEALVGAGLVLFEWVAQDASMGRVISMAVHLVNTFLLLAALALTAWWASGGRPIELTGKGITNWALGLGFLGVLLLGVSGAVTALGDTLFPASSLAEGIQQDFNQNAHFLVRVRIWHPVLAVTVGFYIAFIGFLIGMFRQDRTSRKLAGGLVGIFVLQLGAGLLNLVLLAPVWMQIVHLLLADAVWITLVLFAAVVWGKTSPVNEVTPGTQAQESPARQATGFTL